MGLLPELWSLTSLVIAVVLMQRFVNTQDPQNYYFSAPNTQNRFVPSASFSRQPSAAAQSSSFLPSTRGSGGGYPPQPGSYQEQLLFIANDGKQQQKQPVSQPLTSAAYSPFNSQFSQNRNPDYFDISPRPFGLASGASGGSSPSSPNSFTRSKAIRPGSIGLTSSNGGFVPQQQQSIRTNVPHQQTQFLSHFSEPSDKGPSPNRLASTGFGNSASRPFGNGGGFSPSSNRNRPAANSFSSDTPQAVQPPQQQLPFRNTRNRFQPSSATATTSTTTSTEASAPAATSGKRYNRFGAGRTQQNAAPIRTQTVAAQQPATAASTSSSNQQQRPSFSRTAATKSNSFQPRRPVFISREINEPVHPSKQQRPFALNGSSLKQSAKEKLLKQQVAATSAAVKPSASDSLSDEYDEEEVHVENHVGNGPKIQKTSTQEASLEKLELHEAESNTTTATSTASPQSSAEDSTPLPTSHEEEHTLILTSNFFLPDGTIEKSADHSKAEDEHASAYSYEDEEEGDDLEKPKSSEVAKDGKAEKIESNEKDLEAELEAVTTARTPEYEYEYVEEDESTEAGLDKEGSKLNATSPKTTTTAATTEASTIADETTISISDLEELAVTTELPQTSANKEEEATIETSTEPITQEDTSLTPLPKEPTTTVNEDAHHHHETESEDDEEYYDEEEDDFEDGGEEGSSDGPVGPEVQSNEEVHSSTTPATTTTAPLKPSKEIRNTDREVISVVTTKSVVNGSTAYPAPVTPVTTTLSTEEESIFMETKGRPASDDSSAEVEDSEDLESSGVKDTQGLNNATESYVVIASIQTSRSINGARFLPFPAIEQEETKQTLSELERKIHGPKTKSPNKNSKDTNSEQSSDSSELDLTTGVPENTTEKSSTTASSTESIIDKLDRVQSELSSGLLSGKYPIISQMDVSTAATSTTSGSRFAPNIRKFQHKTTAAPKVKIHHFDEGEMDELSGLLPVGFKPKYKNRKVGSSRTTTTQAPDTSEEVGEVRKPLRNSTISRSFKNSPVNAQEVGLAGLLPKGYKMPITTTTETAATSDVKDIFSKIKFDDNLEKLLPKGYKPGTTPKPAVTLVDDISKFLPPGYKIRTTTTSRPTEHKHEDINKFLPPGYKPPSDDSSEDKIAGGIIPLKADDISKFLPPGFKLDEANKKSPVAAPESIDISQLLPKGYKPSAAKDEDPELDILKKVEFKEVASLLPPGFNANTTGSGQVSQHHPASTSSTSTGTTEKSIQATTATSNSKVVFPKSIRKGLASHRLTTPRTHDSGENPGGASGGAGASPPVVIKKGPPMRATTEFTGWPTPSTTPLSIEKLLEQARTATINFEDLLPSTSTTTSTTTTSTTTTTTTPRPTKPGHCTSDCDLAATIKIIDGVAWKPELLDHNTLEWKNLAREVEAQLNDVYSNAPQLSKWYKKVRIDSFSKGSVLVDYYVELANITMDVNTLEIKKLFHESLIQSPQPLVPHKPEIENETDNDEANNSDSEAYKEVKEEKLVKESFLMGKYVIDPMATDFSVIPKNLSPTVEFAEEDLLIPQWAIVVIVIGVGSLIFVVIFGVTVLLSRQKRAKKTPIPLTNDMLNELKINHMGGVDNYGADDFYNIDDAWNDSKQPIKPKRFTNSVHGSNGSNIYDSWRSTRQGDYYYDSQTNYSQKGDSLQRSSKHHQASSSPQHQPKQQQLPQHHHQYAQQQAYGHQYPDAFADAHQMYTYNNHGSSSRPRYPRDYDPDF